MKYAVTHTTTYLYHELVSLCHNLAMLSPRDTTTQLCKSSNISISPTPEVLDSHTDFFGNKVHYFAIEQEHDKLTVTVNSIIEKMDTAANNNRDDISWEEAKQLFQQPGAEWMKPKQFIAATAFTEPSSEIAAYAALSFTAGRLMFDAVFDLMQRIHKDFEFKAGFTTVSTPLSQVMKQKKGVCQDFAHLAISCLHAMGLPAKYISGYIETIAPPGKEKLVGVDASHAWFAVFIPGMGWVEFDPTNNKIPDEQYIVVAWGRDYFDIVPLKGVIMSSSFHELKVSVDVRRLV